jgi:hypothetical protein
MLYVCVLKLTCQQAEVLYRRLDWSCTGEVLCCTNARQGVSACCLLNNTASCACVCDAVLAYCVLYMISCIRTAVRAPVYCHCVRIANSTTAATAACARTYSPCCCCLLTPRCTVTLHYTAPSVCLQSTNSARLIDRDQWQGEPTKRNLVGLEQPTVCSRFSQHLYRYLSIRILVTMSATVYMHIQCIWCI